jgi:hypothetical protein
MKKLPDKKIKVNNLLSKDYIRAADVVKKEVGVSKTAQLEKALQSYYATYYRDLLTKHGIDLWKQQ